jgi:putative ABC transport system ATP-binding protein
LPESVLRTDRLGRAIQGAALVTEVSIEVASGERLVIVGPSGSGKSSLLRLLNRLDEPTEGTVFINGVDYRTIPPQTLRRTVGMVTQRPVMFPGTVADNIRFGPQQRASALSDEHVNTLLARVGLTSVASGTTGFAARSTANLSGGEAQRVALARALANAPSVLLLDEPTSALDEDSKAGIEALIQSLDVTCVLVTHDMAQARRMATRILTMTRGRLC